MVQSEPVVTTGAVAVVVGAVVEHFLPHASPEVRFAVVSIVVGAVAALLRRFSFSASTIRDAGLDPGTVERKAKNTRSQRSAP